MTLDVLLCEIKQYNNLLSYWRKYKRELIEIDERSVMVTFLQMLMIEVCIWQLGRIGMALDINVGPRRLLLKLPQRISMHIEYN